jgi:ribosome maturation factor RimP
MLSKKDCEKYLGKVIRVLYSEADNKRLSFALGTLEEITDTAITLKMDYNIMTIPFEAISKIKMSIVENE